MPDRRRTERQSTDDNNPFAPPPEGAPDQPWQPRRPEGADDDGASEPSQPADSDDTPGRWSSRQPGRSSAGWGRRSEGGQGGQGGGPDGPQEGPGLRWDPTDPAQRRARYALLAGMWAFFFAIFNLSEIALLLGALALYWAISSLRAKPKPVEPGTPGSTPVSVATTEGARKRQRTAAISGLVTGLLALSIVAAGFTFRLAYSDYFTCVEDSLTQSGQQACNRHLPEPLRKLFDDTRV
ncbi:MULTISPECIES: hypothetical protein [Streptomyces]|uniref:Integral membrane protein n=1 Tax=Streptomyces solicathayae TaxID=3081768 RepID=A0ABZ0LSY7_9ACTN|nr:hypothetical protein [Streptomyces sp. HUAS YS2]WOX22576.1 hypothetical protein R2D22_14680 [Streptomyces sp. HUAS YS2]